MGVFHYKPSKRTESIRHSNVPFTKQLKAINHGLPFKYFKELKNMLQLTNDAELCKIIGINLRTLSRRKQQHRFSKEESDRIVRIIRVFNVAVNILGTEENAVSWLKSPQFSLNNMLPIELLETELGSHEVETLLYRVDYGIFA